MKRFLNGLNKFFGKFSVRLILLVACIFIILALGGVFTSEGIDVEKLKEFFIGPDTLAVFLAAFVSLIVATVVVRFRTKTEESRKVDDDHHKIICLYNEHKKEDVTPEKFYTPEGYFMYLEVTPREKNIVNPEKDSYSKPFGFRKHDIESYMSGKLYLPSVTVFANINGDVKAEFDDKTDKFVLPEFIRENALNLMLAHNTSRTSNGGTVRLNDIKYDFKESDAKDGKPAEKVLTLFTGRTQYFDMLITNRCMDYKLQEDLSLRDIYESKSTVTPLGQSQLGNQIGINGLIFTRDGYLLVEKRGLSKAIWKDKFAQPISLAMKLNSVDLTDDGHLKDSVNDAFQKIILKTIGDNFGLSDKDIFGFDFSRNFLGIARDLLEGGKPNFYFYVVVNQNAEDLCKILQEKAEKHAKRVQTDEKLPKLTDDKLDSDFYLIHKDNFNFNYNYVMRVRARDVLKVKRKFHPQVTKAASRRDGRMYRTKRRFNKCITKECGEALLACLCFVRICQPRLDKEFEQYKTTE